MASFASLPQELVDHIVELATPPFSLNGRRRRSEVLRAFCLTSKAFLEPARQLLYREVAIDNAVSLSATWSAALRDWSSERFSTTKTLVIDRSYDRPKDWPRSDQEDHFAKVGALLERLQVATVATSSIEFKEVQVLDRVESVVLDAGILDCSALKPHTFKNLRRLSLSLMSIRSDVGIFTGVNFPSLVTLQMSDTISESFAPPGRPRCLKWSIESFPLLPQLRGASVYNVAHLLHPIPLVVLDAGFLKPTPDGPALYPSSLKVLRIHCSRFLPSGEPDVSALLFLLASPDFRSRLLELHLVGFLSAASDTPTSNHTVEDWCEAQGVKLVMTEEDSEEPVDHSFFRFLDGVKSRLGLDV